MSGMTLLGRVGRVEWAPQPVHARIPGMCDCVTFHGQRSFAGAIKLLDLRRIIVDCPDGPNLNTRALKSREFSSAGVKRNMAQNKKTAGHVPRRSGLLLLKENHEKLLNPDYNLKEARRGLFLRAWSR